jgi:hypothetical protein
MPDMDVRERILAFADARQVEGYSDISEKRKCRHAGYTSGSESTFGETKITKNQPDFSVSCGIKMQKTYRATHV